MSIFNLKVVSLAAVIALVGACGSSGSGGNDNNKVSDGGTAASGQGLSDIAGVWDLSADSDTTGNEEGYDEAYLVITAQGDYIEYDYLGDDYASLTGDNENCYEKTTVGTITDNGNGQFGVDITLDEFITIEQVVDYSVVNGELSAPLTLLNPSGSRVSIPAASKTQAEMESMICE